MNDNDNNDGDSNNINDNNTTDGNTNTDNINTNTNNNTNNTSTNNTNTNNTNTNNTNTTKTLTRPACQTHRCSLTAGCEVGGCGRVSRRLRAAPPDGLIANQAAIPGKQRCFPADVMRTTFPRLYQAARHAQYRVSVTAMIAASR